MIQLKNYFDVNIVLVINITINKTFGIHDLLKNYSCYNVFNWGNMNTFNVSDKNKFTQIRNIDIFSVLTVMQVHADNNKFMQIKNGQR